MKSRLLAVLSLLVLILPRAAATEPVRKDDSVQSTIRDFKRGVAGERRSGVGQTRGGPTFTNFSAGSSVSVPDGGTALIGSTSGATSGSNRFGSPILRGRPFTNGSTGRSTSTSQASVRVRIIILEEEEERQTGYSSRRR